MTLLTVVVLIACTFVGYYELPAIDSWRFWSWSVWSSPLWLIRFSRLVAAATVGAGLASAGMTLQALLRNPLAEPFVLGVSSGAGLGVLIGGALAETMLLPFWLSTPALAALGAIVTILLVFTIAQRAGVLNPYVLLLSGVVINIVYGALTLALLHVVKREQMIMFIGWQMGRIPDYLWSRPHLVTVCAAIVLGGWGAVVLRATAFNLLSLGDDVAASAGVNVRWLRTEAFLVVSLMTAASVALAGPIGFVGLIVPHACRLMWGADHRLLAIVSGFSGAVFLMVADTLCRWFGHATMQGELPVGVATALIGGPVFLVLLRSPKVYIES